MIWLKDHEQQQQKKNNTTNKQKNKFQLALWTS